MPEIEQYQSSGNNTPLDRAWEMVDAVQPGLIPLDAPAELAAAFASLIQENDRLKSIISSIESMLQTAINDLREEPDGLLGGEFLGGSATATAS